LRPVGNIAFSIDEGDDLVGLSENIYDAHERKDRGP
jgi:hypothetical protein